MEVNVRQPWVSAYVLFLDLIACYLGEFVLKIKFKKKTKKLSVYTLWSVLISTCIVYFNIMLVFTKKHFPLCSMRVETCLSNTYILKKYFT